MRRLYNKTGKIEIAVAGLILIVGGSYLPSLTAPDRRVAPTAAAYDTSYSAAFSCAGYDGCPSSGLVKLKFTPKAGSHTVRWQTILGANTPGATRIGTLTNVDGVRFPPLDLAAGGAAGIFIGQIGPDPVNDRGFGIYKLDSQGRRVGQPWWKKAASEITYCEPPSPTPNPGGRSQAAIHRRDTAHEMGWNCGPLAAAAAYQSTSSSHTVSLISALRRGQPISPLWISCSGGCCDVGSM
jgi:hypothetical protein